MGRWDRWYEARSVTPEGMLQDELVKTLLEDLGRWPPPIEGGFHDDKLRARFAPILEHLLAGASTRPTDAVFRTAFQLARWELERAFEALDHFARNDHAARVAQDAGERLALEFLHRWLTEFALEILEVVPRLKRRDLVAVLQRAEARLLG
jgi:hypothetical protein